MIIFLYIACIATANVLTASIAPASILGLLIPAGTWFIGINFFLRDFVQVKHGRKKAYIVIVSALAISAVTSFLLGDALYIVFASAVSFAFSEAADTEIFTRFKARLAHRVIFSGAVAGVLDSAIFALVGLVPSGIIPLSAVPVAIAGQVVVKCLMQLPALALINKKNDFGGAKMTQSQFEMVTEFQQAFGHPVGDKVAALRVGPGLVEAWATLDLKDVVDSMKKELENDNMGERHFRARLLLEEVVEFMEADDVIGQVDAMLDLLYIVNGTLVMMGVDPEKPFKMVHAANMRKLWPDGKPRWNAEGKVMKPEGWVGPEEELKAHIERLESGCTGGQ